METQPVWIRSFNSFIKGDASDIMDNHIDFPLQDTKQEATQVSMDHEILVDI